MDFSENGEALDAIREVVPASHYLGCAHTHSSSRVAQSIADAGAVVVTGAGNAKTELVKHIRHHDPRLMDLQLVAYARKYFDAADRMQPQLSPATTAG